MQFFSRIVGFISEFARTIWGDVTFHSFAGAIVVPIVVVSIGVVCAVIDIRRHRYSGR